MIDGGQSMEEMLGGNVDESDQNDDDVVLSDEGANTLRTLITCPVDCSCDRRLTFAA